MDFIKIFAAGLVGLFLATPAGAKTIDAYGVVVFNQADVNAGNITPGDTPGFPASLLVSGSYRLSGPLTLTSLKNGIVVSAPAVSIDLNNFKLSGAAVGRNGIVSDQIDTKISNGIIRNFTVNGIEARGLFLTVDRVHVTSNGADGLYALIGGFAKIIGSTFHGNGAAGLECTACIVQESLIGQNGTFGMWIASGSNIFDNVIYDNSSYGIGGTGSPSGYGNNTIVGNDSGSVTGALVQSHPNSCLPACP